MIEPDTIKILRECDAGIKMGVTSIDEVLPFVKSETLKKILVSCKRRHEQLKHLIQEELDRFHDEGKDPSLMLKTMSWVKTNMKLVMHESDKTIADLMIEGSDMGVKSLSKYLNQYKAAEEKAKDYAKQLIQLEEQLSKDMRAFL